MLPEMTIENKTATIGAGAPEDHEAMLKYMALSEENKEKVNLFVQTLLEEQCTP